MSARTNTHMATHPTMRKTNVTRIPTKMRHLIIGVTLIFMATVFTEELWLTTLDTPDAAWTPTRIGFVLVEEASMAIMAVWPRHGAVLPLLIWAISPYVPVLSASSIQLAAMFATIVAGYLSFPIGIATVALASMLRTAISTIKLGQLPDGPSFVSFVASFITFLACTLIGRQWRQWQRETRLAWRHEQDRQRREAVLLLHDDICNELSYALMTLPTLPDSAERSARQSLTDALGHAREAITVLERADDEDDADSPPRRHSSRAAGKIAGKSMSKALGQAVRQGEQRLRRLGFDGHVIMSGLENIPNGIDRSSEINRMAQGLIVESFGNIARHAEPSGGYALTIAATPAMLEIIVSDAPRSESEESDPYRNEGGTGLNRYRELAERLGGSLEVNQTDGLWHMRSRIPLPRQTED